MVYLQSDIIESPSRRREALVEGLGIILSLGNLSMSKALPWTVMGITGDSPR